MAATAIAGTQLAALTVVLTPGSPFAADFQNSDPVSGAIVAYPANSVVQLKFNDSAASTWSAAVSGSDATFAVPATTVTALLAGWNNVGPLPARRVSLWVNGVCTAAGRVQVVPNL